MEKAKFFMSQETMVQTAWNSANFGMEIQGNELNCSSEQLSSCFFNQNWDNSMDQSDPFESALSSMVSSPATSNAGIAVGSGGGDSNVLRELIGRLGSICNSGELSPQSYINGNNSTNTSCYNTPLSSPPKLNLSVMDHQIRGNLPIPGNQLPTHPSLAPFSADPGFAERAARFSCFGSRSLGGGLNGQLGLKESELSAMLASRLESGKLSRVSSNQPIKVAGSLVGALENKDGLLKDGIGASEKTFSRFSRSSTTENGDTREESSISEQIPGGENAARGPNDPNAKKRKSVPRGKAKEVHLSPSAKDVKVAADNEESNAKRSKQEETNGNEKDAAKEQAESNVNGKAAGEGNQKQNKENPKPPEPPKDYIHVRARRGQATDSHSLAERLRREKISERMKLLQDLVPGCNKVTGKAVMLDEIINYVQSLQRQVEFLSMKLATINPTMGFNMETLLSKDIIQSLGSLPHGMYPLQASAQALPYTFQSQQGPNLNCGIPNGTENSFTANPLSAAMRRNPGMALPSIESFGEAAPQASTFWEDDLQSLIQMGFGQNQPQNIHGTMATAQMKVEL